MFAVAGTRPFRPVTAKGHSIHWSQKAVGGQQVDVDGDTGRGSHLLVYLGEVDAKVAVGNGEVELDAVGIARFGQQQSGAFDVLLPAGVGRGAPGRIAWRYQVVVGPAGPTA